MVNSPTERDIEERERFWNYLDNVVGRVGNSHEAYVLGDLNKQVGDRVRVCITGEFGVPGENDIGGRSLISYYYYSVNRRMC